MSTRKRNGNTKGYDTARAIDLEQRDRDLLDGFDAMVRDAVQGDRRAIGIIAIVFGPQLNAEARQELGPRWEQDSGDVLQDFFLALCEGQLLLPEIRGAGLPWMKRMVREIARKYVREKEPPGAAE